MLQLYQELKRCKENGLKGVLGTIIKTEGSTYQKAGAKCFIAEDGKFTGLLSGGCVEDDLKEHSKEILQTGVPKRVFYDFRGEDDFLWGLGLGCNGSIEIFLETYDLEKNPGKAMMIEKMLFQSTERSHWILTIIESGNSLNIGQKFLLCESREPSGNLPKQVLAAFQSRNESGKPEMIQIQEGDEKMGIFIEHVMPEPKLIVFGAGPDALPLVNGAKLLNWSVTLVDHRPAYLNKEHFPNADHFILNNKGEFQDIPISSNTFIVVMTHHFEQDNVIFQNLITTDTPYIGLLGPRKRTHQFIEEVLNSNPELKEKNFDSVFNPVGLDINSKTPEEIAFSILAEIISVYRGGGNGLSLRTLSGPYVSERKEIPLSV
ncbi:XdhC family protein [Bacillus infantis]|uniref:XdhC family protein n=1 Tax=Bacillus infantis TaxID=324767 RepID=UPI003CF44629